MIKVTDISKTFYQSKGLFSRRPIQVLNGISFEVKDREIYGIVGPNGSGKTTILKILANLVIPDSGRVSLTGPIGLALSDERSFYHRLTGTDNLMFFAQLNGLNRMQAQAACKQALSLVMLTKYADQAFKNYSHGMKRRLIIARSILCRPKVLLLDEPTSGLDPLAGVAIRKSILELNRKLGQSTIIVSQDIDEVMLLCDQVAILSKGKIKSVSRVNQLKSKAAFYKKYQTQTK